MSVTWLADWMFLAIAVAVVSLSFALSRQDSEGVVVPLVGYQLPSLCTTKNLTGVDCPGCGLTRSFISLAHGDLSASLSANPVGWFYFMLIAAQIPYRSWMIYQRWCGKVPLRFGAWPLGVLAAMLIVQWLVKMSYWGLRSLLG